MERPARNSYLRILDSRGAPDRAADASGAQGTNTISEASKTYSLDGNPQSTCSLSPRCFFAAARTLDSGFWTNPIHTTTKYFYGFRLDRAPDRVPSPDATFSWSPDSGLWILDWAHSAYLPLPPSGRRTPDPGLRTPDPGRTPDSGLRTPDSGLRTPDP